MKKVQIEINMRILDLIKKAPKCVGLYCPLYACTNNKTNCNVIDFHHDYIWITCDVDTNVAFLDDGAMNEGGEIMLFPSKDVRDWGCFRVKYIKGNNSDLRCMKETLIKNGLKDKNDTADTMLGYVTSNVIEYINCLSHELKEVSENSAKYKYIIETGTRIPLDDEVSDVVVTDGTTCYIVNDAMAEKDEEHYISISVANAYNYRNATKKDIDKWNKEILEPQLLHYSLQKQALISWFRENNTVVVRNEDVWTIDIFKRYDPKEEFPFIGLHGKNVFQAMKRHVN